MIHLPVRPLGPSPTPRPEPYPRPAARQDGEVSSHRFQRAPRQRLLSRLHTHRPVGLLAPPQLLLRGLPLVGLLPLLRRRRGVPHQLDHLWAALPQARSHLRTRTQLSALSALSSLSSLSSQLSQLSALTALSSLSSQLSALSALSSLSSQLSQLSQLSALSALSALFALSARVLSSTRERVSCVMQLPLCASPRVTRRDRGPLLAQVSSLRTVPADRLALRAAPADARGRAAAPCPFRQGPHWLVRPRYTHHLSD